MELDALAGNLTNPFECLLFAVREVIDDHDFVAALQKCDNRVSANVACSTRDQNSHAISPGASRAFLTIGVGRLNGKWAR